MNRDKVTGMLLGIGIGDALGMPAETFTSENIKEKYGRLTDYVSPKFHKWYDGQEAGTTTDDTQLTIAVAKAIIEDELNIDVYIKHHIDAFKETTVGWGHSTRESVRRLANGEKWNTSGRVEGKVTGLGNGVAMKIAPLAIPIVLAENTAKTIGIPTNINPSLMARLLETASQLCVMTHNTNIAYATSLVHLRVLTYLLAKESEFFSSEIMLSIINTAMTFKDVKTPAIQNMKEIEEDIVGKYELLRFYKTYSDADIVTRFGGGNCYCTNSLPFSYAFFMRNPTSIESLYDCVNAGGDTDTNGSIVASMLGALHGVSIFPSHLVDGLKNKEEIIEIADAICDKFKIER